MGGLYTIISEGKFTQSIQDIIIEEKDTIMYNIKKGVEQRMQDNINTLNKELVDAKISLDEIYLDPNNPSTKVFK